MTEDEIIALWRQHKEVMGFARTLIKEEREACAALVDANAMACHNPIYRGLLQANAQAIRSRIEDPMPLFDDWPGGWQK